MVSPDIRYTQCSGDDSSPCPVTNPIRWDKTELPSNMSFRASAQRAEESTQAANFTLRWFIIQRGGFLRSADATVGMTDLKGGFIYPHRLYSLRAMAMNHRRYIAWFHSITQVIFETWRAAGCRPYIKNVLYYRAMNAFNVILRQQKWGNIRPPKNCQLSIVHCQLEKNCQLSTVNCQLSPRFRRRFRRLTPRAPWPGSLLPLGLPVPGRGPCFRLPP